MNEIVARGEQLLAQAASKLAAEDQARRDDAELRAVAPSLVALLNTLVTRIALLEDAQSQLLEAVMATRVRRPYRDANGQILYVVDELNPPSAVAQLAS